MVTVKKEEKDRAMSNKNDAVSYRRELEVRHRVDVLVAGGGPGGIAVQNARRGDADNGLGICP